MSVYTTLSNQELQEYLEPFAVGPLLEYQGVAEGVENTNYFVTTDQHHFVSEDSTSCTGEYVLTLFEDLTEQELPFFVDLLTFLAEHGLAIPSPQTDNNGVQLKILADKPALLFPRVSGGHLDTIKPIHCAAAGKFLGQFHNASIEFSQSRGNHRGPDWCHEQATKLEEFIVKDDLDLLHDGIKRYDDMLEKFPTLPSGIIHGDLFRDNVLFEGDHLTGVIDFYNACSGPLIFDIAVVINDWCSDIDGNIDEQAMMALIEAYAKERPFTDEEKQAWPMMIATAAFRFWVSRLIAIHCPQIEHHHEGMLLQEKDPAEYKEKIKKRLRDADKLTLA